MQNLIKKIPKYLYGRTAKNIYFWLFLLLTKIFETESNLPPATFIGLNLLNIFFFIIPCTLNNFILIPHLLRPRKYLLFIGAFVLNVVFFSLLYSFWLKFLIYKIPGIDIFNVSIVSTGYTSQLNFSSVLSESSSLLNILFLLVFAFTGLWYINDYRKNEQRLKEALAKQAEAELGFLRSQINPHFLFNTLNNLYGLAIQKSEQVPDAILKLSSVLRYILYESNANQVSFEKEKEIMQSFIDTELLRVPHNANVNFSITGASTHQLPPLLWLPVLENVFKHSAAIAGNEDYFIDYRFYMDDKKIIIHSKNTYNISDLKKNNEIKGGIGLDNLRKRLELLFPGNYQLNIERPDKFYLVNLTINRHEQ